jgi:hypothetical protein
MRRAPSYSDPLAFGSQLILQACLGKRNVGGATAATMGRGENYDGFMSRIGNMSVLSEPACLSRENLFAPGLFSSSQNHKVVLSGQA